MMEAEVVEQTEVTQEQSATESTEAPVQDMATTIKALKINQKSLNRLFTMHLQELLKVLVSSNGVSELKKRQAAIAIDEAFQFALDFGVDVTKAKIRDEGTVFAAQTNNLAAILVKALDNRMVLLANNMYEQEQAETPELNAEELLDDVQDDGRVLMTGDEQNEVQATGVENV